MSSVNSLRDECLRKLVQRIIKLEVDQESLRRQVVDVCHSGEVLQADSGHENHRLLLWSKIQILDDDHKKLQNRVQELFVNLMDIEMQNQERDQSMSLIHSYGRNDEVDYIDDTKKFLMKLKRGHYRPRQLRTMRASKILWSLVVTICYCLCGFFIYQSYCNWATFASTISKEMYLPLGAVPFPAVSICTEPYIHNMSAWATLASQCRDTPCDMELIDVLAAGSFLCPSLLEIIPSESWQLDFNNANSSVLKTMIPPCSDVISGYQWLGGPRMNCAQAFQTFYINSKICHSFNVLPAKQLFQNHIITKAAALDDSGLEGRTDWSPDSAYVPENSDRSVPLHLKRAGEANSLKILIQDKLSISNKCSENGQPYEVAVHSPWELPTRSDHHFLKLPPSHSLYISVTPELISYQPSECQGHSQVFSSYQQSNCFLECRSRCSTSLCGCVPLFQPRLEAARWCGLRRRYCSDILVPDLLTGKITWEVIYKYYQNEIHENFKNDIVKVRTEEHEIKDERMKSSMPEGCSCFCPSACSKVVYFLNTQLLSTTSLNKNNSEVRIYYEEGSNLVKNTTKYSVFPLPYFLGCVGGLLALFTSCNLLKILNIIKNVVLILRKDPSEEEKCLKLRKNKSLNIEKTSQTEPLFMTNSSFDFNSFL